MKRSLQWLAASLTLLVATPFLVVPEIMGNGPRHVSMWRNLLAATLLATAAMGILLSLIAIGRVLYLRRRG